MTLVAFGEIALHVGMPWRTPAHSGDHIELRPIDLAAGGGTAIVCQHLAALGHRVRMVPMVARDGFGDAVLEHLETFAIEMSPRIVDGTRTTVAVIESGDDGAHRITYAPSDSVPVRFLERVDDATLGGARFTYSPGFPGFEPLLKALADAKPPLIVDLGYRPWLTDADVYRREVLERAAYADYVALSGGDLADDQLVRLLSEVRACGPTTVVATLGARGAVVLGGDDHVFVPGIPCRPVHTVGAGDAFVAGFVAGLSEGRTVGSAALLGNATAGGRVSAFPRILGRDEIEALMDTHNANGRSDVARQLELGERGSDVARA